MIKADRKWAIIVNIIIVTLSGTSASDSEDVFNCSRYEFYTDSKTWTGSKEECGKKENGTLICMETYAEWDFIKNKIENGNYGNGQEWFIGLLCQNKDEQKCKENNQWSWVNGKSLNWRWTLPWQNGKNEADGNGLYAKVWKNEDDYVFDDVTNNRGEKIGYICEYPNVNSGTCKVSKRPLETTLPSVSKTTTGTQSTTKKKTTTGTQSTTKKKTTTGTQSTTKKKTTTGTQSTTTKMTTTSASIKKTTPTSSRQSTDTLKTTEHTVPSTNTNIVRTIQSDSVTSSTSIRTQSREITPYKTSPTKISPNPKENISEEKQIQKEEFPITYLAIALAVLLLFLICMLVAIYCWRNKKKDKVRGSEEAGIQSPTTDVSEIMKSNSFVAFKMVHNNIGDGKQPGAKLTNDATLTDGTYAEIKRSTSASTPPGKAVNMNENSTSSPSQEEKNVEVVYAAVDKSAKKKKGNQEPQVTYADLASFNNNEDTVVHMPPPYQPVQYAEIIGTKTSKGK